MDRIPLYTYNTVEEFNQYIEELEDKETFDIYNYERTGELLETASYVSIDISAFIEQTKYNSNGVHTLVYNFKDITDTSKIIIKSDLVDQAMKHYYMLFSEDTIPLYEEIDEDVEDKFIPFARRSLYTYENSLQLNNIISLSEENEIHFDYFSQIGQDLEKFKLLNDDKKSVIIDITNITLFAMEKAGNNYVVEQLLGILPNFNIIINKDIADEALDLYRVLFSSKEPISELLKGVTPLSAELDESEEKVIKITDLSTAQISDFHETFSSRLFGHEDFKSIFKERLDNFVIENSINLKKIFSVFLLGNSGIGKTEVAKIIQDLLNKDTKLIKINFGNYSTHDALNSLIGSPRGYVGSQEGELSVKISKSKAGIVLCDEFEKTTYQLSNFFLELLQDGVFTDSMSREYNLDGYIIIFTSNINETELYKIIAPELISRLDIIAEFNYLTSQEKMDYINYQIQTLKKDLEKNEDLPRFSEEDIAYFKRINIDSTNNLRDLKRNLHDRMLNRLKELM